MKKFFVLFAILVFILVGCGKKERGKIKIGITQIIEHPALDAAKEGFLEALKANGYEERMDVDVQNAQGDFGTAQNIANLFVQDKKDIILAISTPSSQAVFNATKEIPILITAVTDPVSAGLVGDNITGTSDAAPVDKQMEIIKKLLPNAKKVGIIYNTSEQNSQVLVQMAKEEAKKHDLVVVEAGITSINEMTPALDSLLPKVDVLYTPTDNLVVSATPLVVKKANDMDVPVVGCIKEQVEQGALVTETIDYYRLGYQTGEMAIKVLNGEKPSSIPVETLKDTRLIINKKAAEKYGIDLNSKVLKEAEVL
jgi:putative ABC transport system substrate-binding protein